MIKVTISKAAQSRGVDNPTQLAKLVKCQPTIIWRYWEGRQLPGLEMIDRICDALNCDIGDLVKRTPKRNGTKKAAKG